KTVNFIKNVFSTLTLPSGARYVSHASPPPVKNFTTITFYTDSKTWNDAARICADHGGKLLDITYYSFFNIILSLTFEDPWKDLLIGNGLAAWISLHRRVTPLGDNFYSKDCQRLSDFQVAYWNTSSPYSVMSGDATSYCVYDQIYVTTINEVTTAKHGYTRAHCDELHQFYCMSESGKL
ncbi:uncharacterized protein LOC132746017, partial [Ruditapes philippinarum]|uniref:uncharacterized protein LOC132746017 n=1 Tax=Ruditapes philippinarum TaxID=129788 RepID=UPI00295C0AC3